MILPKKGRKFGYRLDDLNCKQLLSHSSAGWRFMIKVTQIWSHVRVLFLAYSQFPPHCILVWHPLCAYSLLYLPLLIKSPILLDPGPTLMTLFNFNSLPKGHISQDSPIGEVMVRSAHNSDQGMEKTWVKLEISGKFILRRLCQCWVLPDACPWEGAGTVHGIP